MSHRQTWQSNLGQGHGTVALVVSKLGLLVGRDGQWRVVQLGAGSLDGLAENLLELVVDVQHGFTAVGPLLLQALRTHEHISFNNTNTVMRNRDALMKCNNVFSIFVQMVTVGTNTPTVEKVISAAFTTEFPFAELLIMTSKCHSMQHEVKSI